MFVRFMELETGNKIIVICGLIIILLVATLLVLLVIKVLRKTEDTENVEENVFLEPFNNENLLSIKKKDTDKSNNE